MTVWDEVRRDFPACERTVYLDSAGYGPMPRPVREAVAHYQSALELGTGRWEDWMAQREAARARVAAFIGADADEIAFVANTSTAVNLIADLVGSAGAVLSDEMEFPSVTLPFIHRGIAVHLLPSADGIVRLESFEKSQAPRAATIAVSHVQVANGCRMDLAAFGAVKANRHLVIDVTQSAGAFPVDVRTWAVDALACGAHTWLCAGYGAGFLYVARALGERFPPRAVGWLSAIDPAAENRQMTLLRSAARTEVGSPAFASIFALGAAVEYIAALGQQSVAMRVLELNLYLTSRLTDSDVEVLSPPDPYRSGQTLCAVPDPVRAAAFLRERNVIVAARPGGVRISTHFFNNEEDIDRCVGALVAYREGL